MTEPISNKPSAEQVTSVCFTARGHVWNNYNPLEVTCIVCGKKRFEPSAANSKDVPYPKERVHVGLEPWHIAFYHIDEVDRYIAEQKSEIERLKNKFAPLLAMPWVGHTKSATITAMSDEAGLRHIKRGTYAIHALEAAETRVAELEKRLEESAWVKVEDRLPEDDTRVLVYRGQAHPDTDTEYGFQRCYLADQYPLGRSVTHWRPLAPTPTPDEVSR